MNKFESIDSGTIELSPEEFLSVFNSGNFLEALRIAAKETMTSGYETGFSVEILGDRTAFIPDVYKGGTDDMLRSETIKSFKREHKKEGELLNRELLNLHFHPSSRGAIVPSRGDLTQFLGAGAPCFMAVGQVEEGGEVKMLLVRPTKKIIYKEDIVDCSQRLFPSSNQEEIEGVLSNEGFESFLISFEKTKKGYQLDEESKRKLSKLSQIKVTAYKGLDYYGKHS